MTISKSLESLEEHRASIANRNRKLGRPAFWLDHVLPRAVVASPVCHCHQPKDPGHGPNFRLTYKVHGKTVAESLPGQAATRKAEREIAEFRKLQALHKEFVEVNTQICRIRPPEPDALLREEKKRPKRCAKKSRAK